MKQSEYTSIPVPVTATMVSAPSQDKVMQGDFSDVKVTMEGKTVENYIPLRFVELQEKLISDHPQVFATDKVKTDFRLLCTRMHLRNKLRLSMYYMDFMRLYAEMDPDCDTEIAEEKMADPLGVEAKIARFRKEFDELRDACEFEELTRDQLDVFMKQETVSGLDCNPADPRVIDYKVFCRGTRDVTISKPDIRFLGFKKKELTYKMFQRLVIMYRVNPTMKEELARDPTARRMAVAVAGGTRHNLNPQFLYLKMFKDVFQSDIDTMMPSATIKFTWFDYALVVVPLIIGVASGLYKIFATKNGISFRTLNEAAVALGLIVAPLYAGVSAYWSMVNKRNLYLALLGNLFQRQNLANNEGVINQLLQDAQEQDDNEALLAYFFLWQGQESPAPMSKTQLDSMVEAYLRKSIKGLQNIYLDFEVADSCKKLASMKILSEKVKENEPFYRVVGLEHALELAHVKTMTSDEASSVHS